VFTVPDGYLAQLGPRELAVRSAWIDTLPATATRYARRWRLAPDGPPCHGYVGVVWPVRRADGTPAMLKLSWPDVENEDEGVALRTWAGNGTVSLLADDGFALLLERLDPRRSLNEEPIGEATDVIGDLLRRLSWPAPPLRRTARDVAEAWTRSVPAQATALGDPIPARLLDRAVGLCRELGPEAGSLLVNEDLHYFNVLRGQREPWLVIDPKPIAADPEFAVIPMLWNRYGETGGAQGIPARFAAIVRAAGLDKERAKAWTLIRAVVNWLWVLPDDAALVSATMLAEIAQAMVG
jgi:streptomycin 6-kinase